MKKTERPDFILTPDPAPKRWRRIGKVFEGIALLMYITPAVFIALEFGSVPLFGGRVSNGPSGSPALLSSSLGYWIGLSGYVTLAFCAIVRIVEGLNACSRLPYGRLVAFLGIMGCSLLVFAAIAQARNV